LPAGAYPITQALVDPAGKLGNYTVTSTNGTLTVNAAPTANFLFVNNQAATGNSIAGYSVAMDGTLTSLGGSPVATGGLGANAACSSVNRLALSAGNNLLFVSNGGDQTISAFLIDPASGALTASAGSPFASGLTLDSCSGISLSATPDGRFLMASSNGQIKTFSIAAGGTLTALSTAVNPVVPNASMKITANGQLLAVSNGASVSVFSINPDGSLTAVAGSPFAEAGTGSLAGLDFSSTSGLLFGAEASATAAFADAWTIGTSGVLSSVAGSPFSTTAINSNVVLLSPNDSFLFASNQGSNSVSSYGVNAGGSLSSIGTFGSAPSLHAPVGMATDRSGTLLYVADDTFGVAVFRINGAGSLSQLGDVAIANAGQVQDLVAYPPRMASNADLSVAISASSANIVAGQNVTYTITLTNNGADPAAATVTDSLPSGFSLVSCTASGNGACVGSSAAANFYLLQSGETQTVTLVAQTSTAIPDGTVTTDTASISNSSAVDANVANNSATANVTVAQPATTTLAVAAASTTYGSASTTLSATLTTPAGPLAGKTVSFTLNGSPAGSAVTDATGVASVTASLTGFAAGSYPITASFAGDVNNTSATGSSTLTVNPAVLTVTSANATRIYGDANPAFSVTITGFVNGETAAVVSGSPSCTSADPTVAVGTYPITCATGTLSAANYTFTFVSGNLTITPAALSVAAADASRVYGDPNPAFTGTITGIKNGDNITASYSTTATVASTVGTYPIAPALVDPTGKLGNYTVTSANGTLTITPAPLSVVAANATRFYGDPNPAFTGTITGIKNADNITATYSSIADPASAPGTYPIVPALVDPTGKLSNYTVTSANGVLTVSPAPLVVTAANASRLYGDQNPAFTGSISGVKNGDTFSLSFSSVADATSAVGTYPIVPALTDPNNKLPNYAVTINNGTLTVNPAPLTVSAANASRVYGDPNPAFTGTLTGIKNGDNITATYSSVDATAAVGTYPIVPALVDPNNKLGNYIITSNNGTLTITPAPLTVAAANSTRLYGDPNSLSGTITGIKNGDNITATYASADPTAAVGTYPIVPTLVDPAGKLGNYTVTSTNGTLTITQAPLSLVAANSGRAYGDPNNLSGTITGIKNGDNITAVYSTTATATSAPGTYPITASLLDPTNKLGNYSVTITNATLTVTPATLTVTAANASMFYGDAVPSLSGAIAGIKNGDNITASYTTPATSTSAPGAYAIVAAVSDNGTGALANYTVVINNGTLTVSPAPLVVTAANASRLYGDPNPGFTGTISGLKNGDNIGSIFSAAADPTSPVGNYAIIPTLTDPNNKLGNYAVTLNNGVLTVAPAPLSVAAADNSRLYGDPNPAFTGALSGIKNGDNITASFSSTADATSPVGTYSIVPTLADPTAKLANYVVTSTNGTLTIIQAPLTIQANDATGTAGQPFPTFTGTIIGLKNTDVITASYSTPADQTSPAGTYPIIPSADPSPALGNYAVTVINGTLTLQ
jgi:6-phosphogluconolactonase (cycloisomerase 2 family)